MARMSATEAEVRQWFLAQGLPLVVSGNWRGRHLVRRASPAVAATAVLAAIGGVGWRLSDVSDVEWERRGGAAEWVLVFAVLAAAAVVLPLAAGWVAYRAARGRHWWWATAGVLLTGLAGVPVLMAALTDVPLLAAAGVAVGVVLLAMGLVYVGASSVVGWAIRYAAREVSAVAQTSGRLLPLLLLILVVFFTGELWQWAARVPRAQVWGTVALLVAIGLAFIATSLRDEVGAVEERRRNQEPQHLRGTPFEGTDLGGVASTPLTRAERLNVFGKLLVSQLIQVVVFSVVIMVLFVLLGRVMLPDDIIAAWSGQQVTAGTLFGARLPVPQALMHMSILLAALSGLYFAVNTSTDAAYRKRFFDPLLAEVAVALAARDVYLADLEQVRRDPAGTARPGR